ncbi:RNA polymerase sigma-70 factor, ECF subfamily [Anaerovirgula multivorans]|uniref:RNA polymerase sigma-70 factor, ECF subfamily n=1 Tax=Anaerovirgula multivorans TaxID=312168 RepID=A0A239IG42_9FIRM|nr:RNA polymerase sigma factor [Anaerovirgula multivorans]SNS92640.1 RNA polymerase sigma-70 factor, ECF subfamily [Anaerovirgula multivorans]
MRPEKIDSLVDLYGNSLYKFCRKLTANKVDADDLYQETFLKGVEQCHKIDESNNPKGYLISISIYIWKSNRRKYARRQNLAPDMDMDDSFLLSDDYNLENDIVKRELYDCIKTAVNCLDDKFRIPIYMYYTVEMTVEDIASTLKIPSGTVKSRLYKARALIKKRLEAVGYGSTSTST